MALVTIGDQLGLYRAMGDGQPVTAAELARRTATHERYVREWLNAQAAGGFVTYDDGADAYVLPLEHALVLADDASPVAMTGIFQDVGCGHGAATILMAEAFPASNFLGVDLHPESVEVARERARQAGVSDRVRFELRGAGDYPGDGYELITFFDALHDLGDPVGAARHALSALAEEGSCLVVDPFASDTIAENLTPIGRMYYAFSTLCCTPGSLSQPVGAALGTQAGESRLREVLIEGGFDSVRRAGETPLNLVLEARRRAPSNRQQHSIERNN